MHDPSTATVVPDRLTETWRDGLERGELLIQRCAACSAFQHYPREHCSHCGATSIDWIPAAGSGSVHSFTVIRRTPNEEFHADLPYVLAIVELDEGVRVTTRIRAHRIEDVACDRPVTVLVGRDRTDLPTFVLSDQGSLS